jgi:hypothetical protein
MGREVRTIVGPTDLRRRMWKEFRDSELSTSRRSEERIQESPKSEPRRDKSTVIALVTCGGGLCVWVR